MTVRGIVIALALAAGAAGCDKGGGGAAAARGFSAVLDAWNAAGLTVSAMTPDKSGAIGGDCTAGTVSGVDVVLCKSRRRPRSRAAGA